MSRSWDNWLFAFRWHFCSSLPARSNVELSNATLRGRIFCFLPSKFNNKSSEAILSSSYVVESSVAMLSHAKTTSSSCVESSIVQHFPFNISPIGLLLIRLLPITLPVRSIGESSFVLEGGHFNALIFFFRGVANFKKSPIFMLKLHNLGISKIWRQTFKKSHRSRIQNPARGVKKPFSRR